MKVLLTPCVRDRNEIMSKTENQHSFDFLYVDCSLKDYVVSSFGPELLMQYKGVKSNLNDCDTLMTNMKVKVYPKSPYYEIYYEYEMILSNRKKSGILFDSLSLYAITINDVFNDYSNERQYIVELLELYGYSYMSTIDICKRIPLVPINASKSAKEFLGGQHYLGHILCYGEGHSDANGNIVMDIDQSLSNIAEEIIHLANHSKVINGNYVVDESIPRYMYSQTFEELGNLCKEYGGCQLPDKAQSHVWHIGTCCTNEGDIQVVSSTYLYISLYIKTFYIQVRQIITVQDNEFNTFSIKRNTFSDDAEVLLDSTAKMYYETIEILESLGYERQQEINYKVCIDVVGDEMKKEIEIGELLFGLQPNEYSYIDTIMTN